MNAHLTKSAVWKQQLSCSYYCKSPLSVKLTVLNSIHTYPSASAPRENTVASLEINAKWKSN